MPSHEHVRVKKTKRKIPGEYITWSELGKPNIQAEGDVTIATTIFSATLQRSNIVATWFRLVATLFEHCNAVLRKQSALGIVPCKFTRDVTAAV